MSNIVRRLSYPIPYGEIPGYLTKDEIHRVKDSITKDRDRLMISFLWETGVRVSELCKFKVENLDSYAGVVNIGSLKKRGKRVVRSIPIPKYVINELEDYIEAHRLIKEDRVFPVTRQDVYYLVRRYCIKAGIDPKRSHPHVFRHSYGVNCALQGVSGTVIAEWLGHADLSTVMIYAKALAKDTKHIRDGLEF